MAEINLLPVEEKAAESFETLHKRIIVVSAVVLVIVAVFTLTTLVFFTTLAAKRGDLISQIAESTAKINGLKTTEELLVVTKGKISTAIKILSGRTNTSGFFEKLAELVPQGVYFTEMRFVSGRVVITGKAKSSADVSGLVSSLVSAEGAKLLTNVAVDSLNSDEKGIFSFVISSQLAKK